MIPIPVKSGECVPGAVRVDNNGTLYYIIEHSGSVSTRLNGRTGRALILDSHKPEEIATVVEYDEHAIFFMWSTAFFA